MSMSRIAFHRECSLCAAQFTSAGACQSDGARADLLELFKQLHRTDVMYHVEASLYRTDLQHAMVSLDESVASLVEVSALRLRPVASLPSQLKGIIHRRPEPAHKGGRPWWYWRDWNSR